MELVLQVHVLLPVDMALGGNPACNLAVYSYLHGASRWCVEDGNRLTPFL